MAVQQGQPQYITVTQPIERQKAQQIIAVQYGSGLLPPVDVAPPGHPIRINWTSVRGATRAEITSAIVKIGAASVQQVLGDLMLTKDGNAYEAIIPDGKRIASLTLFGCKAGNVEITSQNTLPTAPEQHRLVVTVKEGNTISAPLHAVPPVPRRGMLPASLFGASFDNKRLVLPDLKAAKIRLSLVIKSFPEDFQEQGFSLERVSGIAVIFPTDLELLDPAGVSIWSFPGEYPRQNPPTEVDLRVNLEPALNDALKSKQPLDVTFRLRGVAPGNAGFTFSGAQGALLREFSGVRTTTLEGDPVQLTLGDKLADEQPSSVVADLTATYNGIRIAEELSDPTPVSGPLYGFVVGEEQIARTFPPQAFVNYAVARIGVIGRAPVACELSVQLVEMLGTRPGRALGPPGVIQPPVSHAVRTHWVTLSPDLDLSRGNVGIAVRANQGRFFWAVGGNDAPLVKIAIHDPNPGGRLLKLNGVNILAIDRTGEIHAPAKTFVGNLFRVQAPYFESSLFLTIDVSDLTLRYAR
ncbi:MAG: hypothetical protein AB7P69_04170 [Candidatus Binatia bacterium]